MFVVAHSLFNLATTF